jgi:hypothetical protein
MACDDISTRVGFQVDGEPSRLELRRLMMAVSWCYRGDREVTQYRSRVSGGYAASATATGAMDHAKDPADQASGGARFFSSIISVRVW